MLPEISQYGSSDFTNLDVFGYNTTMGLRKHNEKISSDEKFNALKAAYADPVIDVFTRMLDEEEKEQKNNYIAPNLNVYSPDRD